jgi:hypothetical protein
MATRVPARPIETSRRALPAVVVAGIAVTLAFVWTMLVGSYAQYAAFLIAAVLLLLTVPIARHAARIEQWPALSGWILVAMVVRLGGAVARYLVAYGAYGGVADASTYTAVAKSNYHAFRSLHVFTPDTSVFHGLVPWLDTFVYALFGPTEIGSFFLFSWLNFLGTYLFFRAFRIAYPSGDGRRYGLLVFFLPSLVYWPSSLGKEGWMMLAIGLACYGLARALVSRPGGYLSMAAGIGGMILVRPHLALIFLPAAILAFLLRRTQPGERRPIGRLVGLAVLIISSLVVVGKAQSYFGIKSLDVQTVTQQLQTTRVQTAVGNSAFHAPNAQTPLGYPEAVITVLFRPFPFEAHGLTVLVASLEGLILLVLTVRSWPRLKRLPKALWESPYIVFCLLYSALFVLAFANFSNFGILARERVQMLPLFLVLLAIPATAAPVERATALVGVADRVAGRPERRLRGYPKPDRTRYGTRTSEPRYPLHAESIPAPTGFTQMGTYRALGYTFDVSVEPSTPLSTAAAVPWVLSHLTDEGKPQHHFVFSHSANNSDLTVEVDGLPLGQHPRLADGLDALVGEVNRQAVTTRREKLGLHAAAVSWRGQGILLAGPSTAGKSTLAAALVRDGCGYLTDEAAFVDLNTLSIEPYPKPLSLRTGSLALLGLRVPEEVEGTTSDFIPASYLRSSVEVASVPLSTIVFIRRRPGEEVSYRPIPRAEALVELTNNSFNFVEHGGRWLGRLRQLVLACSCWRLESGNIHAAANAVIHIAEVRAGREGV